MPSNIQFRAIKLWICKYTKFSAYFSHIYVCMIICVSTVYLNVCVCIYVYVNAYVYVYIIISYSIVLYIYITMVYNIVYMFHHHYIHVLYIYIFTLWDKYDIYIYIHKIVFDNTYHNDSVWQLVKLNATRINRLLKLQWLHRLHPKCLGDQFTYNAIASSRGVTSPVRTGMKCVDDKQGPIPGQGNFNWDLQTI